MKKEVLVAPTRVANLASVLSALERVGVSPRVARFPEEVVGCERLVLPGVGALGAAVNLLKRQELWSALRERLRRGKPTLAICLGMQLLCASSRESPGEEGLALVPEVVRRFGSGVRVPHLGWNRVEPEEGCRYLERGWAYFAHSYRLEKAPAGFKSAWSEHGGRFVSALERDGLLACQFHPELSGEYGARLLERWLTW